MATGNVTDSNFDSDVLQSGGTVLVDFGRSGVLLVRLWDQSLRNFPRSFQKNIKT